MPETSQLAIRRVCDEEFQQALKFIRDLAQERERATPPPPPHVLFAAILEGSVVGTVGLEFGSEESPVPLEEIWEFDRSTTPFPFIRQELAQYGRWMARTKNISASLLYCAAVFAKLQGKKTCICEVKPKVAKRLREIGCRLYEIAPAKLLLDKIPESGRPYYESVPRPNPYMIDLNQMEVGTRPRVLGLSSIEMTFNLL